LDQLSKLVYRRTGGVPRFVSWANEYLRTQLKFTANEATKYLDNDNLLGNKFINFVINEKHGEMELRPYISFSLELKKIYCEFVRLAVLQIPNFIYVRQRCRPTHFWNGYGIE
jgi:hypothetical protein